MLVIFYFGSAKLLLLVFGARSWSPAWATTKWGGPMSSL